MANAKINLKIGRLEFSAEGEADWVTTQLDKVIAKASEIASVAGAEGGGDGESEKPTDSTLAKKPLASYLREKGAVENKTRKFLTTSVWLHAKGAKRLRVSDVTKALSDNNQSKLGNASQCLANNINQGHCERDGDKFFVTEDGKKSL